MSDGQDVGGGYPKVGNRLGSFELIEAAGSGIGQMRFHARGVTGTTQAGVTALVVAAPIAGESAVLVQASVARLNAIVAFGHGCVLPVIEAGAWDGGLYLAHHLPNVPTIADQLGRGATVEANDVLALVDDLAAVLDAAAAADVPHGDVGPANVWLRADGRPLLGGFFLATAGDQSAAADTSDLAVLTASLLIGRQVSAVPGDDLASSPFWHRPASVPGIVWECVERGFGPDPGVRYPTAGAFAAAFRESLAAAVSGQVAGVWECLERRDYAMATMLCESALRLRPQDPEILLLLQHVRSHASGGATSMPSLDIGQREQSLDAVTVPSAGIEGGANGGPVSVEPAIPGLESLPPELARILAVPPVANASSGSAWMTLATGMVFLVSLTLVAVLVAMSYR